MTPRTGQWSAGPKWSGDSQIDGFATSHVLASAGTFYSTVASGIVYRDSPDDASQVAGGDRLLFPRMFLRLYPLGEDRHDRSRRTGGMTGRTAVVENTESRPGSTVGEKVVSWTLPYEGEAKQQAKR